VVILFSRGRFVLIDDLLLGNVFVPAGKSNVIIVPISLHVKGYFGEKLLEFYGKYIMPIQQQTVFMIMVKAFPVLILWSKACNAGFDDNDKGDFVTSSRRVNIIGLVH